MSDELGFTLVDLSPLKEIPSLSVGDSGVATALKSYSGGCGCSWFGEGVCGCPPTKGTGPIVSDPTR